MNLSANKTSNDYFMHIAIFNATVAIGWALAVVGCL